MLPARIGANSRASPEDSSTRARDQGIISLEPAGTADQLRLDNVISVETTLGIEMDLVPAGVVVRILANALDLTILGIVWVSTATAIASMQLGKLGIGLIYLFMFLLLNFYFVFFDLFNNGRSPGKGVFLLRTIHDDGTPIRLTASMIRNLLRWIDFLPFAFLSGIASMAVSNGYRRIGDHAAGTLVVYERKYTERSQRESGQAVEPPVALTSDEKILFQEFVDRLDQLSDDRASVLAETLYPMTKQKGEKALKTVVGIARGIRSGS